MLSKGVPWNVVSALITFILRVFERIDSESKVGFYIYDGVEVYVL